MTQHYGLHEPILQRAWYRGEYKLIVQEDGFAELYALDKDPFELFNLADSEASIRHRMWQELVAEMEACGDTGTRTSAILRGA